MSIVIGKRAETEKDYDKLAEYFLKQDPTLIELWERKAGQDRHTRMLYDAGMRYLTK